MILKAISGFEGIFINLLKSAALILTPDIRKHPKTWIRFTLKGRLRVSNEQSVGGELYVNKSVVKFSTPPKKKQQQQTNKQTILDKKKTRENYLFYYLPKTTTLGKCAARDL